MAAKPEDLLGVRGDGSGQAPELCELLRILHADSTELVVADRNFQKGEQLTFDYGHSKNIELLVSYGFVIPRNAADTVALYESGEEMDSDVVNLTAEKTQPVIVAKEHDEENAELWDKLCAIAGGADRIAWALLMVHSRSFWLEVPPACREQLRPRPQSAKLRVLVPFADQFNHAFKPVPATSFVTSLSRIVIIFDGPHF
eukprot:gene31000-38875_t